MTSQGQDASILLIEDDRLMRNIMAARLEPIGARLVVVNNAEDALVHLEKEIPSLILSDAVMPGMDGFALCRKLRESPRFKGIPFAILTSLVQDIQARSLEAGADDHISKMEEDAAFRIRVRFLLKLGSAAQADAQRVFQDSELLVVSGSATVHSLLQAHLSGEPVRLRHASNTAETLKALEESVPDAMVLDMDLGGESAADLVGSVHDIPWYVCTPILLLLAKAELPRLETLEDRIQDYLLKPLTAKEDRHRVKLLMRYAKSVFAQ